MQLRNNTGGLLDQTVEAGDGFSQRREIVAGALQAQKHAAILDTRPDHGTLFHFITAFDPSEGD
jgi:hypothetical protein